MTITAVDIDALIGDATDLDRYRGLIPRHDEPQPH